MPASTSPYQDIVIAHCKEDLKWLDQLYNFDPSVCSHTRIYIYSKCNADINLTETIPLTATCTTVKQVKNCGIEEYAFFQYILDHYESMSPMVSFLQGGALTENPHVIYDMMVHLPGTTFKSLSRHVREAWHFEGQEEAEMEIMRHSFPHLENKTSYLASWRGMFAASREQIMLHPQEYYFEISKKLCGGTCGFRNCNMEAFFAPFFGCDVHLFHENNENNHEQCEFGVSHGIAPSVFTEDYLKDSYSGAGTETNETNWARCGNKTVYYSASELNGILLCIMDSGARNSGSSNWRNNMTASSYNEMIWNESWKPDLSNLTFHKDSQWSYIPPHLDN